MLAIKNIHIHMHASAQPSAMVKAFLDAVTSKPAAPDTPAAACTASDLAPPAIGETWPGQGGLYGGIVRGTDGQPDAHIVVSTVKPASDLSWQAALDWAKTVEADGHRDFALPTRFQAPILYGNLRDHFEQTGWHWTSTEYSERSAWIQLFSLGSQASNGESYEARARAVRLIPIGD